MPVFDVNTAEIVKFSNKLDKIHRAAFPNAVRNTLNDAAFFTKKNTLQQEARKQFTTRKPSFFRAFSRVQKASGFAVKRMVATVGMTDATKASKQLVFQEKGGTISGRDFIPTKEARVSKSESKVISKRAYLQKVLSKTVDANKSKARSKKQKFVRAAIVASEKYGRDGHVQIGDSIVRVGPRSKPFKGTKKIYDFSQGRSVRLQPKPFVGPAAQRSSKLMLKWYEKEAKKQFARFMK